MDLIAEIKIYNREDRLRVASILVDNGYTVSQGKRMRTPTGKTVDYTLKVYESEGNVETSGKQVTK